MTFSWAVAGGGHPSEARNSGDFSAGQR